MVTKINGEKVYRSGYFERDINVDHAWGQSDVTKIPLETFDVLMTMYTGDELLTTDEGLTELAGLVKFFLTKQQPFIKIMKMYRSGYNYGVNFKRRRRHKEKSDVKISTPFIKQACESLRDFYAANPVAYKYTGKVEETADVIRKIDDFNNLHDIDQNIAFDLTLGRAFELHSLKKVGSELKEKIYRVDPEDIFVIRGATLDQEMVAGVHIPKYGDVYYPTVYTSTSVYKLEPFDGKGVENLKIIDKVAHSFKEVPIVEYRNGSSRLSDFSASIPIQDTYDFAMSDTANYRSDFNDSPFLIKGPVKTLSYFADNKDAMLDANFFLLPESTDPNGNPIGSSMEVLKTSRDTAGDEADKKRLKQTLFATIGIIDFSDPDQAFGHGLSGTAMKQRLSSMYQLYNRKVAYTSEGLQRRWRLISNIHDTILTDTVVDHAGITYTFTEAIPRDDIDDLIRYKEAGIELSERRKLELASLVKDVDAELDEKNKEVGGEPL